MRKVTEIKLKGHSLYIDSPSSMDFDSIKDFKNWSDEIYNKYKKKLDCTLSICGSIGYDFGDPFAEILVSVEYIGEASPEDIEKVLFEKKGFIRSKEIIPLFMKKNNISNTMGAVPFYSLLKQGILKYTLEEYQNFENKYFFENPIEFTDVDISYETIEEEN